MEDIYIVVDRVLVPYGEITETYIVGKENLDKYLDSDVSDGWVDHVAAYKGIISEDGIIYRDSFEPIWEAKY